MLFRRSLGETSVDKNRGYSLRFFGSPFCLSYYYSPFRTGCDAQRMPTTRLALLVAIVAFSLLWSCTKETIQGGRVIVRNDILDASYNSFQIDRIVTSRGASGYRKTLSPGDEVVLPLKGIRTMRFTRRYADHSMVYEVECPKDFNEKITLKLIDVHTNRMDGGCELRKRGRMERGVVDWE